MGSSTRRGCRRRDLTAVSLVERQDRVPRVEQGAVGSCVRLCGRVRLDVCMLGSEQAARTVDDQLLGNLDRRYRSLQLLRDLRLGFRQWPVQEVERQFLDHRPGP